MSERQPVLLVVLVETQLFRWQVAALQADTAAVPLLRSEMLDLDQYRELDFDAQVSYLRHRIAGILQRGCDRLYAREMKAHHFILVADGPCVGAADGVTKRFAENLVDWMMNPPLTYLIAPAGFILSKSDDFEIVAGELSSSNNALLRRELLGLMTMTSDADQWETIARRV